MMDKPQIFYYSLERRKHFDADRRFRVVPVRYAGDE